jgi:DNA-binding MarR family transcriptional regulator
MIGGDRPPAALARFPGFLLNWVAVRSRTRFATGLEQLGLHRREFAALAIVADRPGITQHEVAAATSIDQSTLVATLDALELRGLAERRIDPDDRRRRTIHLTARGERVLGEARTLARSLNRELLAPLDPDERRQFVALLRKLAGIA